LATKKVRSNHWAHYRRGEWAEIILEDKRSDGRPLWMVKFEDGDSDVWVADDEVAQWEFMEA